MNGRMLMYCASGGTPLVTGTIRAKKVWNRST
jgi:hypothetical protein